MADTEKLRAIRRRQREAHRKLFELQGAPIAALRQALTAISQTHDEMMTLFEADSDLEDVIGHEGPTGR